MRVTFGKYLPRNSIVHNMDSRFKLIMIIILVTAIFFPVGFTGYAFLTVVIIGLYALAKLSWRTLMTLFIPVILIFMIIFLINIFLIHPNFALMDENMRTALLEKIGFDPNKIIDSASITNKTISDLSTSFSQEQLDRVVLMGRFIHVKYIWVSERAVLSALLMAWRIYLMITLTTILTASTQPLQLTLAIEDLLSPLKLIRVPVYVFSMIISIALRMIPTLIDEAGRIMKAQASRGIDVKNGKMRDKAKGLVSLIIPLLVSSFQKAEDLAYAMDAREYNPYTKRTRYVQFKFRITDLILFLLIISAAVFAIVFSQTNPMAELAWRIPYIDQIVA